MSTIVIDPVTRVEGHLRVEVRVDSGEVREARCSGTLFRGIEQILRGRDPGDAVMYTQRICGVCPTSHAMASVLCLEDASGLADRIPHNGRLLRNLLLGAEFLQSHVLHFYHLAALDYVDVTRVAGYRGDDGDLRSFASFLERGELGPFMPRYEGDYRLPAEINRQLVSHYMRALDVRRKAQGMQALFGGRAPHPVGIVAGGVTQPPAVDRIVSFLWSLNELRDFIANAYVPDVLALAEVYSDYFQMGAGCRTLLSYGVFDLGGQDSNPASRSRLLSRGIVLPDLSLRPLEPERIREKEASSWLKSPRYDGVACEVGPLARMMVGYLGGQPRVKELVDGALARFGAPPGALYSVMGRHVARALECQVVADAMAEWVTRLRPCEDAYRDCPIPERASGAGLVDAPRGALGHWVSIEEGRIADYRCVAPTTWNASPRDVAGQPGPIEQALVGTRVRDQENPFEIVRIVRSFDPCIACAVHVVDPKPPAVETAGNENEARLRGLGAPTVRGGGLRLARPRLQSPGTEVLPDEPLRRR